MPPNEALHKQQSIKGGIGNEKVWKRIVNHAWSNHRYSDCNNTVFGIIRCNRSLCGSSGCNDYDHLSPTYHIRPRNHCWDTCRTQEMKKIWLWTDICSEPCLFFSCLYMREQKGMNMYLMIGAIVSTINAIIVIIEHKKLDPFINKLYYYYPSKQKVCLMLAIEGIVLAIVSYFLWPIVAFNRIYRLILYMRKKSIK